MAVLIGMVVDTQALVGRPYLVICTLGEDGFTGKFLNVYIFVTFEYLVNKT